MNNHAENQFSIHGRRSFFFSAMLNPNLATWQNVLFKFTMPKQILTTWQNVLFKFTMPKPILTTWSNIVSPSAMPKIKEIAQKRNLFHYFFSNTVFACLQSGQRKSAGSSSNGTSPSYSYPQMPHTHFAFASAGSSGK